MKNKFNPVFTALFLAFAFSMEAQDDCAKDISTNPDQPFNNHPFPSNRYNPWINSDFDIGELDGSSVPPMPLNNQIAWQISDFVFGTTFEMINPYQPAGTANDRYNYLHPTGLDFEFRDYHWEDGWEVLYIGLGFYPNGEPIQNAAPLRAYSSASNVPSNPRVPYIILYNRYRGVMRVFMNLFTTFGGYSDIWIRLQFEDESPSGLSGVLRHLEAFDRPLDQTTNVIQQESYNPNAGGTNRWFSADFQLAYDPCICGKNQEWKFTLNGVETFTLDLEGRGLAVDVPIADSEGNPTYDGDWLDMNGREEGLEGGYQIFDKLEGLVEDYKDALDKYEEDAATYADYLEKKTVLDAFKGFMVDGTTGLIPAGGSLKSWFLKPGDGEPSNFASYIKGASKGLFGYGYNQLSMGIVPKKSAPKPPVMPTASYSEMRYTGEIQGTSQNEVVGPFFIPGSYDESSALSNLDPFNYPAYNVAPGLFAMLKTPEPLYSFSSNSTQEFLSFTPIPDDIDNEPDGGVTVYEVENTTILNLRFEELLSAINNSLDFDLEKTNTSFVLEVLLENNLPPSLTLTSSFVENEIQMGNNLYLERSTQNLEGRNYVYKSRWKRLENLAQNVFRLSVKSRAQRQQTTAAGSFPGEHYVVSESNWDAEDLDLNVKQVNLKVLNDNYFDQIGSDGDQVNTVQVFTYELYNSETAVDFLNDDGPWASSSAGYFDQYMPGEIVLGSELIGPNHPAITSIEFNGGLIIDAQRVLITNGLNIQEGYSLTINALEEIRIVADNQLSPSGAFDPRIHFNIKKDFYNTAVFEYVDDASSFCGENGDYESNISSIRVNDDYENRRAPDEFLASTKVRGTIHLFPNPARDILTIRSSHLDILTITMYDLSGRPIKQENLSDKTRQYQMDLSGIAPGTYLIRVDCREQVFSEKLVVAQ